MADPSAMPLGTDTSRLVADDVGHWFGDNRVLHDVSFSIPAGQIVALVGPSGSGKSTLLRAVLGTHPPLAGAVTMNGSTVVRPRRDIGIVYQKYTLYPFLTARENVAFGPMLDETGPLERIFTPWKWRPRQREHLDQATALLERIGMGHAVDLYPPEMSGGMRQRVAIAQALIMRPRVLLLDEPFGALDEATREELQTMLLRFSEENIDARERGEDPPHTILIVTHELNEALFVGDRVLGLSQHWKWGDHGHGSSPGATILYDAIAPHFDPDEPRCYERVRAQRAEIRRIVMDASDPRALGEHVRYWEQVKAGEGHRPAHPTPSGDSADG